MAIFRMEECPVDESSESPLDMCEDYDISLSLGSQDSAAALVLLAVKSLLSEIRTIEVPSFQVSQQPASRGDAVFSCLPVSALRCTIHLTTMSLVFVRSSCQR